MTATLRERPKPLAWYCLVCGEQYEAAIELPRCPHCAATEGQDRLRASEITVPNRAEDHMAGLSLEREMWREKGYET